jgi:hypothetical protein
MQPAYSKPLIKNGGFDRIKYPVFNNMVAFDIKPKMDLLILKHIPVLIGRKKDSFFAFTPQ